MAETIRIVCRTCSRKWEHAGPVSDYGREALETRACPECGSYTLATQESTRSKVTRNLTRTPVRNRG